jgi:tricorn protease
VSVARLINYLPRLLLSSLIVSSALLGTAASADEGSLLLRFPDVSATEVAFVHAGDIYVAPRNGGGARKLTSHEGQELFPKFSPDGRWIAYSAEYTGTRQVWLIPSAGGEPRQLTWKTDIGAQPPRGGFDYRVLDWTPDGQHVLVRINTVAWDDRAGRPYLVPLDGSMPTALPVPETGGGALSPDGSAYVYTPIDREFRTWKRHRGGRAQDVWIFDLASNDSRRMTDHVATDNQPVWVGDMIYFTSDRDYQLDLYTLSPAGGDPVKVTDLPDFDVLWPSGGPDAVVFEQAGALWLHQPSSQQTARLVIHVASDRPARRVRFAKVADQIESFDLAPAGERAIFGARGELYSVPAKHGEVRNLSRTPTAREHSVAISPDGQTLAYLSDASGEYEIYLRPSNGQGEPRRLTNDGGIWRFPPVWSPDGLRIAYADKLLRLRYVDVPSGKTSEVDQAQRGGEITVYRWSPNSRYLAYELTGENGLGQIWLYDSLNGRKQVVTDPNYNAANPAFDPDGRYLYFSSDRDYNLAFESVEFDYIYQRSAKLFAIALRNDVPSPVLPRSDEIAKPSDDGNDKGESKGKDKAVKATGIDFDGLIERTAELNVPGGAYGSLLANGKGLFFLSANGQGPAELRLYDLEAREATKVADKVTGYALSGDGSKLLVVQGKDHYIAEAKADTKLSDKLDLANMEVRIDPPVEWAQLFRDGWRILRDWFYDEGMHGNDWEAVYQRYAALLPHVSNRGDLDYLFGEIAGELNAGHIYVNRGDDPAVERKPGGLLGAEFEAHDSGYFRFAKVYAGETGIAAYRAPLDQPDARVKAGEYLIAIDGVDARSVKNVYQLLENKAERLVELTVNDSPAADGARTLRVQTLASEQNLRYLDWISSRRAEVERLSGGRVGYVHLPNTAIEGNRELVRQFWPQTNKDALIIDDRYNGGGFIPDRMIEVLARKPLNYWARRGLDPQATPFISHDGPKAMLINGQSSSGGDALPYYFRKLGLGTLIGTRTWGGLIGISGNPGLADGGQLLAATFRFLDTDNRWAVENEGVAPDIEVIDYPHLIAQGRDPSLEKAVEVLLAELERSPPRPVVAPPAPTDFR